MLVRESKMAAVTDERGSEVLLPTTSGLGRNIFLSNHLDKFDSPMRRFMLPAKLVRRIMDISSAQNGSDFRK